MFGLPKASSAHPVSTLVSILLHEIGIFSEKQQNRVFIGQKGSLFVYKIGMQGSCPQEVFWTVLAGQEAKEKGEQKKKK